MYSIRFAIPPLLLGEVRAELRIWRRELSSLIHDCKQLRLKPALCWTEMALAGWYVENSTTATESRIPLCRCAMRDVKLG